MPSAILVFAAVLRLWALGRPDSLVFDELYYVRDAVSQLAHGYPTVWPDDDPAFGGERARAFTDTASTIAHPPLGKWLIALGLLAFGPDTGWGWRSAVAIAGVATIGVTMRIGFLLARSRWVAWIAGLLLALDGVHVVLSRVALLDGFLTFLVALGALCMLNDWQREQSRGRWWLVLAGLSFGAAAAVKWSGLYPLGGFLVLLTIGGILRSLHEDRPTRWTPGLIGRALLQAVVNAAVALPAAFAAYLASWSGWIFSSGGQGREPGEPWWVSLWQWHEEAFAWHSTLTAPHPYQANPLGWPLALRPTAMYDERWEGVAAVITPLPNPLVTWGGAVAMLLLVWAVALSGVRVALLRSLAPLQGGAVFACAFVATGYLSGWLPWVLTFSRSAVFQFYAVVLTPFAALALALVLAGLASLPGCDRFVACAGISLARYREAVLGRRISVGVFLGAAVIVSLCFWPLWIGMPVETWFYRLHLWLPGWS